MSNNFLIMRSEDITTAICREGLPLNFVEKVLPVNSLIARLQSRVGKGGLVSMSPVLLGVNKVRGSELLEKLGG